jgi:S-formylglutathione hydrolase
MKILRAHACYGGEQRFYEHASSETKSPMKFSVYVPPQARERRVPALYFLSGLTCTEETFPIKSHAQGLAAELGLMLISPDTSPREPRLPGDAATWDFGQSAGFYVDATQLPWKAHYRMYSYVTRELPAVVAAHLPARPASNGIFGHSMGGHGALMCALRNPDFYRSVSAFAPIAAPMRCPWGQKAFTQYLGADVGTWLKYDASELVARTPFPGKILIYQGEADEFAPTQLLPEKFAAAAARSGQELELRKQPGYDHGYYFIQSFMADHLRHHASVLSAS